MKLLIKASGSAKLDLQLLKFFNLFQITLSFSRHISHVPLIMKQIVSLYELMEMGLSSILLEEVHAEFRVKLTEE